MSFSSTTVVENDVTTSLARGIGFNGDNINGDMNRMIFALNTELGDTAFAAAATSGNGGGNVTVDGSVFAYNGAGKVYNPMTCRDTFDGFGSNNNWQFPIRRSGDGGSDYIMLSLHT
eukprot:gb/GECH01005954.1/.p1 GENE.gb/GECH01005954.1/~~gb/GECH01005954.1/.p1  ORF type:complete len:117 (+),score=22.71 gb/GECH01005954.1/:1-351(+)